MSAVLVVDLEDDLQEFGSLADQPGEEVRRVVLGHDMRDQLRADLGAARGK
jgi:hypothetical protein